MPIQAGTDHGAVRSGAAPPGAAPAPAGVRSRLAGRIWALVLASVSAIVALLVWLVAALLLADPLTPQRRLTDGTTLYLDAVIPGGESRTWIQGPRWQQVIGSCMSPALIHQLGWKARQLRGRPGVLTLWLRRSGRPTSRTPQRSYDPTLRYVEVFDEAGHAVCCPFSQFTADYYQPMPFEVRAFPRRGKTLGLRIWARELGGDYANQGELQLPNPAPGPYPRWNPARRPAVRRDQGRTVRLEAVSVSSADGPGPARARSHLIASFRVPRDRESAGRWAPVAATLLDATGNRYPALNFHEIAGGTPRQRGEGPPRPALDDGQRHFAGEIPGGVVPGETLRMRVLLARTRGAPFGASGMLTLSNLPLPGPGRNWRQSVPRRVGSVLEVVGIAGPFRVPNPRTDYNVNLHFAMHGTGDERVTPLRATDDRGRPVALSGLAEPGIWPIRLRVLPDARRVSVTLAVEKPLVAEFVIPGAAGARNFRPSSDAP